MLDGVPGGPLDMFSAFYGNPVSLRLQELLDATAEQRPVFLLDGEVPPEIEDGDLAHLAADALATNQAEGEVAFAGGFVVGSGLTDIDAPMLPENKGETMLYRILWHNKTILKTGFVHHQMLGGKRMAKNHWI
ncbi:MAG: hypothetical protein Q8N89_15520 [Azonexus sp.]|nr:hypothetical protein [Azonexus sp.]